LETVIRDRGETLSARTNFSRLSRESVRVSPRSARLIVEAIAQMFAQWHRARRAST